MRVDEFDFELPEDRIALHPASPRDAARMLVVGPDGSLADRQVSELPEILRPGDVLVVNDTKVLPAELTGVRIRDGRRARVALNLHRRVDAYTWRAFARPAKRLRLLDRLELGQGGALAATLTGKGDSG
ncbi:MAG TPA: S-adenosylmethionine:tRNA ribosyltransferase-isomerase, partial [Alphaproteobacteria bacterium]|nr:S-adenosylmethionine:tRNA ribosyltransferase-isomerase [Alphaproteobacteria bacterium]